MRLKAASPTAAPEVPSYCRPQHRASGTAQRPGGGEGPFGPLLNARASAHFNNQHQAIIATDFATQLFVTGWQFAGSRRSLSPQKKNPKQNTRLGFLWTRRQRLSGGWGAAQSSAVQGK